jgi:hypothetical protein
MADNNYYRIPPQWERLFETGNQWNGLSKKGNIKETKGAPSSMQTTTGKHTPTYM